MKDGRRTVVWESDFPVSFFNVIAGRWQVERGEGTAVYYYRGHPYNIGEMREALDAARRYYSEWFYPYPWRELKLSEFPNLASYAQGFPTNITFSEGIGFLTSSTALNHAAFEITSHEAAHQWWGNLLSPGKGPGGNILSEGMSHFSTILLVEQAKGPHSRIDFCKRIEAIYGRSRQADSELPMVKIDRRTPRRHHRHVRQGGLGLLDALEPHGRERALSGIQAFIKTYQGNPDHPVLQDFLASMRPFAADGAAFDAFTRQWFYEVVVPEYLVHDATKKLEGRNWAVAAGSRTQGRASCPSKLRPRAASDLPRTGRFRPPTGRPAQWLWRARASRRTSSSPARSSPSRSSSIPTRRYCSFGGRMPWPSSERVVAHANLVVPGTGTGGMASAPNSYFGGLRSSLELRIISGVMISPV